MHIIREIQEYIRYLRETHHLRVSLHPKEGEQLISGSTLIRYSIHATPYCLYLKTSEECYGRCVSCQDKIKERLLLENPFTGVCHAGVKERVYGIFKGGAYLGFVSVGGYRAEEDVGRRRREKIASQFEFQPENLLAAYEKLSPKFPDENALDTKVIPLVRMIEYGNWIMGTSMKENSDLHFRLLNYLNLHFTEEITISTLSQKFHVSPSTISHTFKRLQGVGIREYLTSLRVDLASNLLWGTEEDITQIAYLSGFSDPGYFSNVFREKKGLSPREYREKKRK